jgi:branched-chain amino acid transport system substrate-binding protein
MGRPWRRGRAVAVCVALVAAACSAAGPGGRGPIVIGSINTLSGPITLPEASQAAQAVFDEVNAAGGIHGRPVRYLAEDDRGDPLTAAQAARDLVDNRDAVALVGSASLLQCEANADYYRRRAIIDITGTGVDPICFDAANISPVNAGPFVSTTVVLDYTHSRLRLNRLCAFFIIIAGTADAYRDAVREYEAISGQPLVLLDESLSEQTTDYTPYILRAKQAGCQAVLVNGSEPIVIGWMKQVQAQNVTGIRWTFLASAYTVQLGRALGPAGDGIIANSEFEPYTTPNDQTTAAWRALMNRHGVPLTSFAQGGYLAARYLVRVLSGIRGEITRASVTHALRTMAPISDPMVGTPFMVGPGERHNSNRASKIVRLEGGTWQVADPEWVRLPPIA